MSEIETPIHHVRVNYLCDECGEPMRHTGMVLTSSPPQYPHACKNGHYHTFSVVYPTTRHIPA